MFMVYFIIGALTWVSAGGKAEKVEKAKNTMTNAAIGLIVIVAAYSVIYIIGTILGIPILEPEKYLEKLGPETTE
jgi:amino acid transporter